MTDTRNYGKLHPRFAGGGLVPPAEDKTVWSNPDKAYREQLEGLREYFIDKAGKGRPQDYEQEQNRGSSVIQAPDKTETEIEPGTDDDQDLRDESERGA
jgi:hypothetical protein